MVKRLVIILALNVARATTSESHLTLVAGAMRNP